MVSNKTPFAGHVSSRRRFKQRQPGAIEVAGHAAGPQPRWPEPGDRKIAVGARIKERRRSSALGAPDSTASGSGQRRGGTRSSGQR